MPLKEVMTDMNNQTKRYKDDNGDYVIFDLIKFKSIFESNVRAKKIKKEDYAKEIADELSCGYDTFMGWKKGKNAPQDIELVHSLETALGLPLDSLLYSREKQLENELNKSKNINAELVLENSSLKQRIEHMASDSDNLNSTKSPGNENFLFTEQMNPYSLRYDGFSNLIDLLIGYDITEGTSSAYAEELSYILGDYIYKYSLAELIGYDGKRSIEELEAYMDEHEDEENDRDKDDRLLRWMEDAVIDANGNRLYDENSKITLKSTEFFKKLGEGPLFNNSDSMRIRALMDEVIKKWDKFMFPFSMISIKILFDDVVIDRYTYGQGYVNPTNNERMDIVTELLFLTNGDIDKYSFQKVKKFHVDQFESEIEIVYDLIEFV